MNKEKYYSREKNDEVARVVSRDASEGTPLLSQFSFSN